MGVPAESAELWVLEYLLDVDSLDDGLIKHFSDNLAFDVAGVYRFHGRHFGGNHECWAFSSPSSAKTLHSSRNLVGLQAGLPAVC